MTATFLESRAAAFAARAHHDAKQLRKYTHEPYILHPAAVVSLVRTAAHDEAMLAAAWLHDVVEDTGVPLSLIEKEFGVDVAALVEQLTDVSKPTDGDRATRKAIDRAHTAKASPRAKTIKLADLIDNSRSVLVRDLSFARVYLPEKSALLAVLTEGDQKLLDMALDIVTQGLGMIARSALTPKQAADLKAIRDRGGVGVSLRQAEAFVRKGLATLTYTNGNRGSWRAHLTPHGASALRAHLEANSA